MRSVEGARKKCEPSNLESGRSWLNEDLAIRSWWSTPVAIEATSRTGYGTSRQKSRSDSGKRSRAGMGTLTPSAISPFSFRKSGENDVVGKPRIEVGPRSSHSIGNFSLRWNFEAIGRTSEPWELQGEESTQHGFEAGGASNQPA